MVDWNFERISSLTKEQVKSLKENALKRGDEGVAKICEQVLTSLKPTKAPKSVQATSDHAGEYVSAFHFVCPDELGVTRNSDGTIWSGTWVVADEHAVAGEKYGSVVALHANKASPSYIQGKIKGWRRSEREKKYSGEVEAKTATGIDFLIEPSTTSLSWKGDGSGEKGYEWSPHT